MDTNTAAPQPDLTDRVRNSKALIPTLAVMAVVVAALAGALVATRTGNSGGDMGNEQQTAVLNQQEPIVKGKPTVPAAAAAPVVRQAQGSAQASNQNRPVVMEPNTRVSGAAPAALCNNCGVVESVTQVERQEPVNGIAGTQITPGTVAGGVIGGLLGNQVGGGSGRTAATVLGAAGGAYAGNVIEKKMKSYTAYQMNVRMADGSRRSFEQRSALAAGTRVVVDNGNWRVAS